MYCSFSLFLPIYSWNTFRDKGKKKKKKKKKKDRRRRKTEDEERLKKKDKEKSRTEVHIEVSWWIADLKTDQLNAFRVNSKRDTLE